MSIITDSDPPPTGMEELRRLYDCGLFRQAWSALESAGGVAENSADPERGVLCARLCSQLGFRDRARRILLRLRRRHPEHPIARHYFVWHLIELRGPLHTWAWLRERPSPQSESPLRRADVLAQEAHVLALLRDFGRAFAKLEDAKELCPDLRWPRVAQVHCLALADRHAEALETAAAEFSQDPHCWHYALSRPEALLALGRDAEALRLLRAVAPCFESPALTATRVTIEMELENWDDALAALDHLKSIMPPKLEDGSASYWIQWIAARRADIAGERGELALAKEWAGKAGGPDTFYGKFASRIEHPPERARQVRLPVGFTRQHHMTCAPATLATLCRYWGRPAEHVEIADAICFDGTSHHSQRIWAENAGWTAREFTVTPDVARYLVDRGLPFVLSTYFPGGGHAQAVIGYDDYRGALLLRDPNHRSRTEWVEEAGYADQAAFGPHGLVLVPGEEASRLKDVVLPDAEAHDLLHVLNSGLERHNRRAAEEALTRLEESFPGSRLTLLARYAVAAYDQQASAAAEALDRHLELYPSDVNRRLSRHSWRAIDAPYETRLAEWQSSLFPPISDPLLWIAFAQEIASDGRRRAEVQRWIGRALRRTMNGAAVHLRARLLRDEGRMDDAVEWYRIASCLEEFREDYARDYFWCARVRGRDGEALTWLRGRVERLGKRGSSPYQTLGEVLVQLDRTSEALDVFEEGIRRRPQDVGRRVFTAEAFARAGQHARAKELLEDCSDGVRPAAWHAAMAAVAESENGPVAAHEHWERAAESSPLTTAYLEGLLRALEATGGQEAALSRLRETVGRFPHFRPHQRLAAEKIGASSPVLQEEFLRNYLRSEPDDAWAWRELAFALLLQNRADEAAEASREALAIEPQSPAALTAAAEAARQQGHRAAFVRDLRGALRQSIDYSYALRLLLDHCHDAASRLEALAFVRDEIIRQHTTGEAVELFAQLAAPHLPNEDLLEFLCSAHEARPDLWRSGITLARHLDHMGRHEEALDKARAVVRSFPLVRGPRALLVELLGRAGLGDEESQEIERALALDPGWTWFSLRKAIKLFEENHLQESLRTLDDVQQRAPGEAGIRCQRARILWEQGERQNAITEMSRVVECHPGWSEAWRALEQWGPENGDPDLALRLAGDGARRRPDDTRSWMILASLASGRGEAEEELEALDHAIALDSSLLDAAEQKAFALWRAGRGEEALKEVTDARWGDPRPPSLRAVEAWLLRRGDRPDDARRILDTALRDDPTLYGARQWAIQWCIEDGEDGAAGHAEEQTRQFPNDSGAWLGLGSYCRRTGAIAKAREAFAQALRLDPKSNPALAGAVELELQQRDPNAAFALLDRHGRCLTPVDLAGYRLRIAVDQDNREDALAYLTKLVLCEGDGGTNFDDAARLLREKGWAKAGCDLILALLRPGEKIHPLTGRLVLLLNPKCRNRVSSRLAAFPEEDAVARLVYVNFLNSCGQQEGAIESRRTVLNRIVRQRSAWFRRDTLLWGVTGYARVSLGQMEAAAKWLADWTGRPDAEPWMINNLLVAQLALKRNGEARAHVAAALARRHEDADDSIMRFRLLQAFWAALDGDQKAARDGLETIDRSFLETTGFDAAVLAAVEWLAGFRWAEPGTCPVRRGEFRSWRKLVALLAAWPGLRIEFRKVPRLRARAAGHLLLTWRVWNWAPVWTDQHHEKPQP